MEEKDPWLALDKVYHVLFCFTLSIVFTTLSTFTRYPFLRRHAIFIGSIASLLAGAAKEAADHLGYFRSAGASLRDAVADLVGMGLTDDSKISLEFRRKRLHICASVLTKFYLLS